MVEEAHLVRRCQAGDLDAFEALFRLHSPRVLQTAYLLTGDRHTAEDVMQDAFAQTFRTIGQVREPQAFSAWLYRTAVRLAQRASIRERAGRLAVLNLARTPQAANPPPQDAAATRRMLWDAMKALPEQQRIAMVLHYFQDRALSEVAQLMDAPEGTVKSWLHRGKAALARALGQETDLSGGD